MSNNKTARRDYIDIMKGLGILLVVLGHFMEQFRFGFKPIGATFICIYLFHMALFCICSGLVAHFSLWKLITQQVWLYAVGQAIMLAFRAVILREDFAASGGLLLAVDPADAAALEQELRAAGLPASIVGEILPKQEIEITVMDK